MTMLKVTSIVRLPLNLCKGSVSERINNAKRLNLEFFNKIYPEFKDDYIPANIFLRKLKETVPGKIKFVVNDNLDTSSIGNVTLLANKINLTGYGINIPFSKQQEGKISIFDIRTFMHETMHLFLKINNPKFLARSVKIYESGMSSKLNDMYRYLYSKLPFDQNKLELALNQLSIEEKINFLQSCRNKLLEEKLAYSEGNKYFSKTRCPNDTFWAHKLDVLDESIFMFDYKIKILNNMLKETLQEVRKK